MTNSTPATTGAGAKLQSDELQKQAKKASGALLAVAIIQAVFGAIIISMLPNQVSQAVKTQLMVVIFGIAAAFFGLFLWALKQPLPAAIVGLALFVTVHLLDAIADPTALVRGILMKIIIIAVLVKAIQAGLAHRRLMREAAVGAAYPGV